MSSKLKMTYGILGAFVVAGVAAWIYQLINGLGVTGMNNGVSWGLYITCFMFFGWSYCGQLGERVPYRRV